MAHVFDIDDDAATQLTMTRYRTFFIYGLTRHGKCVTGDTRVLSPDGRYERIDDVIKWGRFATLSVDENGHGPVQASTPSHYHDMGISQVFALELTDGRRLRGTPEHPILTVEHGYVPLAQLSIGDHVVVADNLPYFGAVEPAAWEPRLLGYFIGDGSLTQGSPSFAQLRPDILSDFVSLVELAGDGVTMRKTRVENSRCPQADVTGGKIKQWLADHGLWGRGSRDKFVPDEVFSWTPAAIKQFVRALFDCDGHLVTCRRPNRTDAMIKLALVSTSRELLDGVGHLLRRFSIRTRIRYIKGMLNGVEHGAFELRVATLQGIADFVTLIGISRPNAQQIGADAQARALKAAGRIDPGDLGDGLRCEAVKSIEAAGEAHVYDLTVPGIHNFLANDMVVHNTRFIGSCPNACVISDASERGYTTLKTMRGQADAYYHADQGPFVIAVENAAEMNLALAIVEKWVKAGYLDTVGIDSATFYTKTWLTTEKARSRAAVGSVDTRALYGALAEHMNNVRIQIHSWRCNVVWTALMSPPDDNKPGGPLIDGSTRDTFPAGCDHIMIARAWEAMTEATETEPATPYTVYEMRTKPWGKYIAGSRDGGKLPDPIYFPSFRKMQADLGLVDANGEPIEYARKQVPKEAKEEARAAFEALKAGTAPVVGAPVAAAMAAAATAAASRGGPPTRAPAPPSSSAPTAANK